MNHLSKIELYSYKVDIVEAVEILSLADNMKLGAVINSHEIQKIAFELVQRPEEEIVLIFSSANAYYLQVKTEVLELLKEATLRDVKVRILVPIGNNDKNRIARERIQEQLKDAQIDIRTIKQTFQNKLSMIVIYQSLCLTVELKDDTKETYDEAIGLATYFNSDATVFSYVSIFENLWIQTQLDKRRLRQETPSHLR